MHLFQLTTRLSENWNNISLTGHQPAGWLVLQKSIAAEDSTVFIGGGCSSCNCSGKQGECINHHQQRGEESLDYARGAAKNINIEHMGEDFERGCFLEL